MIAIIYRPPAPPVGAISDQSPPQPCATEDAATALCSTSMALGGASPTPTPLLDGKNTKAALVPHQPSHPQENGSHARNSSSSSSSTPSLKKRQQQQPVFVHVANVGDCRAVLCRGGNAVVITTDHTPSVPSEAARVEAAGGFVSRGRVNGILGVSRSFGDIHCKVPLLFCRKIGFCSSRCHPRAYRAACSLSLSLSCPGISIANLPVQSTTKPATFEMLGIHKQVSAEARSLLPRICPPRACV